MHCWLTYCGIFNVGYPTMGESTNVLWDNLLWDVYCGIVHVGFPTVGEFT